MFKGIAFLLFAVFLVLSLWLPDAAGTAGFYPLLVLSLPAGWTGLVLLTLPDVFFPRIWTVLRTPPPQSAEELGLQLEALSRMVREEGLLALESRKKEFQDPHLRGHLKRIVEGFEAKDLLPMIRNQARLGRETFAAAEEACSRAFSFFPTSGLIQTLILVSKGIGSPSGGNLFESFLPFLVSLVAGTLLEASVLRWISERKAETDRYFGVLEEGIEGIQQGHHPDLLRDRLRARTSSGAPRVET